ncbi:MAG: GspH/FimT family pseudopilin [Gammaproteobacteria bacterium]
MSSRQRLQGFTLIEMILVLVIAVLLLGTVGPRIAAGIGGIKFRAAAQEIASALRHTRAKAVSEQREATLAVFLDDHEYEVDGGDRYLIPEDVDITVYTASTQVFDGSRGDFVFFPDGSASGGRITLEYRGQTRFIYINWLTGLIEVLEQRQ